MLEQIWEGILPSEKFTVNMVSTMTLGKGTVKLLQLQYNFKTQNTNGLFTVANSNSFFIPRHPTVASHYGIKLVFCVSICPSGIHPSEFPFQDDNLSKSQWTFTKFGVCIDILEIWFGIANGKISLNFDSYLPATHPCYHFQTITSVNIKGLSPNLVCALILWRSPLGLLMSKLCQFLLVDLNGFSPSLICAVILWRSGMELLIGKLPQFLTEYLPTTR